VVEARYIGGRSPGQGRYALAEVVGRGGFATVWRARIVDGGAPAKGLVGSLFGGGSRHGTGEDVAVKVIPVYSAGERSRALREGQIASGLRHPNIVETLEVIAGETEVYLVTEFVHGLPLDEAGRHYTMGEVTEALCQILEALAYAHEQGVIHRDIKPQNALVDARDGRVKLTDFGVAYRVGDTRLTQVGFAVGTPGYIAPEVLDGEDPTELTDIYAVGATARTLLARLPDEPPPRLREFVDRATSPNPAHRPRSAAAALRLLTGRREGPVSVKGKGAPAALSSRFAGQALRGINGLVAGWLGFLGADLLLLDSALALGVATGFAVLGFLLPRLGALGVIVTLAVILLQSGQFGLGFSALLPALGLVWVGAGSADAGLRKAPLAPLVAIPLAALPLLSVLAAGIPLLLGALMRPVGAALSGAVGALALVVYEISFADRVIPYIGGPFIAMSPQAAPQDIVERVGRTLAYTPDAALLPPVLSLVLLWSLMAAVISVAEWSGRWIVGLAVAMGAGILGYVSLVSDTPALRTEALISLVLAGIIYGVARYLGSRG